MSVSILGYSQSESKNVTITSTGYGKTSDFAIQVALRKLLNKHSLYLSLQKQKT
jgi:hypothetical protein